MALGAAVRRSSRRSTQEKPSLASPCPGSAEAALLCRERLELSELSPGQRSHRSHPTERQGDSDFPEMYLVLPGALSAAALEELPSALPQPAGLSCGSHTLGELGKPREGWGAMAQPGLHCQGLGGQGRSVPPAQLLLQGKATVSWAWPSNPAKQSWETPAELSAQP